MLDKPTTQMVEKPTISKKSQISPLLFCCVVLATGLLLLAIPFPDPRLLKDIAHARLAKAPMSIVGASTIDYVSTCDTDKRNIADMLRALTGRQLIDLSVGGQLMSDSISLSAVAGRNPAVRDVILPLAYPYIDDWTTPYFRKLPAYKLLAPEFSLLGTSNLSRLWGGLSGQPRKIEGAYRFEGKDYPDYRQLSTTTFATRKKLETCPEAPSSDPTFTRSYYWWTYVATEDHSSLFTLIPELHRYLRARGKHLIFVLLPINLEYIAKLDPSWPGIIRKTESELVDSLKEQGVDVVDLSDEIPSDEFTDRWVGPVHFYQKGRLRVAQEIAAKLHPDSD
jgi:hypothetical protein